MLGVCLKHEQVNYGSKLQALATIRMLEEMEQEYEIIHFRKDLKFYIKSLPRFFNRVFLNDRYEQVQRTIGYKRHPEVNQKIAERRDEFASFDKRYFEKFSVTYESYGALKAQCAQKYDKVLTCSDQLWSPAALGSGFYNLMFVPENTTKVSWASSFGVGAIPWFQRKRTRAYLQRIQFISMRENRGAEIVRELTGREVPVLMDPVFVFDKNQWDEMIPWEAPEWDDYIFCYFLGKDPQHREAAKRLAEKTGKRIVTLRHLDQYVPGDEAFGEYAPYDVDPQRFLNIVRNAAYICTDSFHGCAFSVIYEKKFVVFNRYRADSAVSKNSRIDTLCGNLGLESRRYLAQQDILAVAEQQIDYPEVSRKLAQYRERTRTYLANALGSK